VNRRLAAASLTAHQADVDRPEVGPFDWLISADDKEFRSWAADTHPIPPDTYRRLPLAVRLRLAEVTDPDAF